MVTVVNHPLIRVKLGIMRDEKTSTKEFREKLYSEIERAYAEAKEKQQEQAKEESQKQGKEQSQDKDGFMKASGEPLPFR